MPLMVLFELYLRVIALTFRLTGNEKVEKMDFVNCGL